MLIFDGLAEFGLAGSQPCFLIIRRVRSRAKPLASQRRRG